jgi:hypothetical protein
MSKFYYVRHENIYFQTHLKDFQFERRGTDCSSRLSELYQNLDHFSALSGFTFSFCVQLHSPETQSKRRFECEVVLLV